MKKLLVITILASTVFGCTPRIKTQHGVRLENTKFKMVIVANGETNVYDLTPEQSRMVGRWVLQ